MFVDKEIEFRWLGGPAQGHKNQVEIYTASCNLFSKLEIEAQGIDSSSLYL